MFALILLRASNLNQYLPNGDLISGFRPKISEYFTFPLRSLHDLHIFFPLNPSMHAHGDVPATGYLLGIVCLLAHFAVKGYLW
jgi:hypothetical protein